MPPWPSCPRRTYRTYIPQPMSSYQSSQLIRLVLAIGTLLRVCLRPPGKSTNRVSDKRGPKEEKKNDKYMHHPPPHLRKSSLRKPSLRNPNLSTYMIFRFDVECPRRTPPSNPLFSGSACLHRQHGPNPPGGRLNALRWAGVGEEWQGGAGG